MKKTVLFLSLVFFSVEIVQACICERQTFEERIEKNQFIFIGKVLLVEDIYSDSSAAWPDRQKIVIEIEKKFKGNQSESIVIESQLSTCAPSFEKGESYLVFGGHYITNETEVNENFVATNNSIVTSKCHGTKAVELSKNEIQELEKHYSN